MQRMMNEEDGMDKFNQQMQNDLVYERDRNIKIRHKLKEQELYKNDLLRDLKNSDEG
jgi:hypothetical protein